MDGCDPTQIMRPLVLDNNTSSNSQRGLLFSSCHVYMFFRLIDFLCRLDGQLTTIDRVMEAQNSDLVTIHWQAPGMEILI